MDAFTKCQHLTQRSNAFDRACNRLVQKRRAVEEKTLIGKENHEELEKITKRLALTSIALKMEYDHLELLRITHGCDIKRRALASEIANSWFRWRKALRNSKGR